MDTKSTFIKGLNSDLAKSKLNQQQYDYALNMRHMTDSGQSTGAISNTRGNETHPNLSFPDTGNIWELILSTPGTLYSIDFITSTGNFVLNYNTGTPVDLQDLVDTINTDLSLIALGVSAFNYEDYIRIRAVDPLTNAPLTLTLNITTVGAATSTEVVGNQNGLTVIGSVNIRDTIILLTTNEISPTGSSIGQIWRLDTRQDLIGNDFNNPSTFLLTLLYNNALNFSLEHPVAPSAIVGNYENDEIQRIYWCDFHNKISRANVVDPDLFWQLPGEVSISPTVAFDIPVFQDLIQNSGNIRQGLYQMIYRYSDSTGTTTGFGPPSQFISVVAELEALTNVKQYTGFFDSTASITKSIKFRIDNLDQSFDRIQVGFLRWTDPFASGAPDDIIMFYDEPVPDTDILDITYSGLTTETTLSIDDYLLSTFNPTVCKTMVTKDQLLLIGNVKAPILDLDFDARAFRYTANNATVAPNTTYPTGVNPDEDNDINPNQAPTSRNNYIYQQNSTVLGGTGSNVSYKFVTDQYHVDAHFVNGTTAVPPIWDPGFEATPFVTINGKSYPNFNIFKTSASPAGIGVLKSYQRNEIYRMALVLFDLAGNPGWVKWIGDIQFPDFYMPNTASVNHDDRSLQYPLTSTPDGINYYANALGIDFTVDVSSIADKISGYSVVRVPRTDADKTMMSQGIMNVMQRTGSGVHFTTNGSPLGNFYNDLTSAGTSWSNVFANFISPETQFNSLQPPSVSGSLEVTGVLNDVQETPMWIDASTPNPNTTNQKILLDHVPYANIGPTDPTAITKSYPIIGSHLFNRYPDDNSATINTVFVYNRSDDPTRSQGNRNLALMLNGFGDVATGPSYQLADGVEGTDRLYSARLTKIVPDQYGGNTIAQKSNNKYISCNHYQAVTPLTTLTQSKVYGGDVWVQIFDVIKEFKAWDVSPGSAAANGVAWGYTFPTESNINTPLREGGNYKANTSFVPNSGAGTTLSTYEEFSYRTVWSKEYDVKKFFPKPDPFIDNTVYDNRVYYSNVKISGELVDNWGIFKDANYRDVDAIYGPINAMNIVSNKLFFWQDRAFGYLPVNRRALQQQDNAEFTLGAGVTLDKHEYVSNTYGTKHQWSVVSTDRTSYWYDSLSNKIINFNGQSVMPISDVKGFHGYLDTNLNGRIFINDNPVISPSHSAGSGVCSVFDYKYNEMLMTFKDYNPQTLQTSEFTISYSEMIDAFSSFHSFIPKLYITDKFIIITQDPLLNDLYVHDYGRYGYFYDLPQMSSIKFLVNDHPDITKTWNTIQLQTEVQQLKLDTGSQFVGVPVQETFDELQCTTDYQDTTSIMLISGSNIKRKFRSWWTTVPRDSFVTENVSPGFAARMRDKYMYINLGFTNNNNKRIILHDVTTSFIPSIL